MIFKEQHITDYCIVPINQVPKLLAEGFQPYGSPFVFRDNQDNKSTLIYQALVKSSPSNIKHTNNIGTNNINIPALNDVEQGCIEGLLDDLNYEEIANKLHRSPKTIRNIMAQLRQKWQCKTNVGLIVAIKKHF